MSTREWPFSRCIFTYNNVKGRLSTANVWQLFLISNLVLRGRHYIWNIICVGIKILVLLLIMNHMEVNFLVEKLSRSFQYSCVYSFLLFNTQGMEFKRINYVTIYLLYAKTTQKKSFRSWVRMKVCLHLPTTTSSSRSSLVFAVENKKYLWRALIEYRVIFRLRFQKC